MSDNVKSMPAGRGRFCYRQITAICLLSLSGLAGCTGLHKVVPAPLVFEEQSQELLKIAPVGTQKEQAIERLNAAGVSGEFSSSPSIYYCDLWEREDGKRWHLNVALLFNEAGELYKTRPAQADVSLETARDFATASDAQRE